MHTIGVWAKENVLPLSSLLVRLFNGLSLAFVFVVDLLRVDRRDVIKRLLYGCHGSIEEIRVTNADSTKLWGKEFLFYD